MKEARLIVVTGRVQGVGFRPFVYRLAAKTGVVGWVRNITGRVLVHVEGTGSSISEFTSGLIKAAPSLARPVLGSSQRASVTGFQNFEILASQSSEKPEISIPPDLFMCADCLAEMHDPSQHRADYPFINCTQCGPRYTIITAMPYDRANTSMGDFQLCPHCRAEYENPTDRRFHAQPLACADCGPELVYREDETEICGNGAALRGAGAALSAGKIVAIKGVGGYHLMCDAANDRAVKALRDRKQRPDKPFAIMVPFAGEDGLEIARRHITPDGVEETALSSPERPIVLAAKRDSSNLSKFIAPGLQELGVFLPYTPLHHLLLDRLGAAMVATSGNVSGEPVITDAVMAEKKLSKVADAFLHHNRPIVRPADDSVIRVICGQARTIRAGRGMAPIELELQSPVEQPMIAVGGQMKNAIALAWDSRAVISPHIGEMDSKRSQQVFSQTIADLQRLYGVSAGSVVFDKHEGYAASRWARRQEIPKIPVYHHHAHASGLAGEYPDTKDWLVFTWDGVGLGKGGSLWGGEGFVGQPGKWKRVASWRAFTLCGGDKAGREPWRSAAGLMWESKRRWNAQSDPDGLGMLAWKQGLNTHRTTAVGRIFDAAACLITNIEHTSFEGQGPMLLESLARQFVNKGSSDVEGVGLVSKMDEQGILRCDWEKLLPMLGNAGLSQARRAYIFHKSVADAVVDQVGILKKQHLFEAVGLTGGVFQNRLLGELVVRQLEAKGILAYLPQLIPANDGGLAFGQIVEAQAVLASDAQKGNTQ